MKIGLVSSDPLSLPGGIQEHVKGLCKIFNAKGHEAKIIAPHYQEGENCGKDVILVGGAFKFFFNASRGNVSYCLDIEKLNEILRTENFDVLHFHNPGFFTGLETLFLSNSTNFLTVHVLPDLNLLYKFGSPFIRVFTKVIAAKFAGAIAVSNAQVRYLKFLKNCFNGRLTVIPNGVDTERFKPSNKKIEEFVDDKVNILFVGRMDKRKGLHYLIDAFHIVKRRDENTRLIVVGDGFYREKCERIVENRNLKDVVFVGNQSAEDIPRYYATSDIFCSPAFKGEAFGMVLLEAMSTGKPIVAFANRGYREILHDYDRRFLVRPKSTQALAKALLTLVKNDGLRKKLGAWGLEESKKYSWDIVGNQVLDFYSEFC